METPQSFRCGSIEVSTRGFCEWLGKKRIISVPRERIVQIALLYGTGARHPVIQILAGLIVITIGIFLGLLPLYHFAYEAAGLRESPDIHPYNLKPFAFALPLMLIGVWLFLDVLRRRYYLLIKCDRGYQKLVFRSPIQPKEVSECLHKARQEFQYHVAVGQGVAVVEEKGVRLPTYKRS